MIQPVRIAWFTPLPPARSGIAAYSAELVPRLAPAHAIDCFSNETAGDFLWKARRDRVIQRQGTQAKPHAQTQPEGGGQQIRP
jgi:hypothetical protein